MPQNDFGSVWERLPATLKSALVRNPARELTAEEIDELVRAGARQAHALWLESRPGRRKQWLTSWDFRRFIEHVRDAEQRGRPRLWSWSAFSGVAGRD